MESAQNLMDSELEVSIFLPEYSPHPITITIETVEKVTNHKVTTTSVWSPRFSKYL